MRLTLYTFFTFTLLLVSLVACQDHGFTPNVTPDGRRYQLKTMTYTNGSQTDSRTFTYNAANQLVGIETLVPGSYPLTINQTNTYNGQGKHTELKAVLLDADGQDLGSRKVFGYDGMGRINQVTLYNIFPPPLHSYQVYRVYSDSLRYDGNGRVVRVDRKLYDQPVRGNNFLNANTVITIDYDGLDNPTVITSVETPTSNIGSVYRTRTVFTYDDKPNALAGVDFPANRNYSNYDPINNDLIPLMKRNPVTVSIYGTRAPGNNPNDLVLTQRLSAMYTYSDGLPVQVRWTGTSTDFPYNFDFTYTFGYTFY